MKAPPVPLPFRPARETVSAGTVLYRVHRADYAVDQFNATSAVLNRWSAFGTPTVPVLYAAASREATVFETRLRGTVPGSVLPVSAVTEYLVSPLRVTTSIEVAQFHSVHRGSAGLHRLGVLPEQLTATSADNYADTVEWARAVHRAGLAGITWMCHRYNAHRAFVFFGDLLTGGTLAADPTGRVVDFATPEGLDWLVGVARTGEVTLGSL